MNYQPDGLLFDETLHSTILHPTAQWMHDWMHTMCVGGVVQTTLYLLFDAVAKSGVKFYPMVEGYMKQWILPKGKSTNIAAIFNNKRAKSNSEAKTFKATASELLAFVPILAYFVQEVVVKAERCVAECKAFLAVADLLEIFQSVSYGYYNPILIKDKVSQMQDLFIECNWQQYMHSKFHWLVHMASHLTRFKLLLSCWVHERKHRIVKRYAQDVQNTVNYERSILLQVVSHDLALLQTNERLFSETAMLQKQCKPSKKVMDFVKETWDTEVNTCFMCASAKLAPDGVAHKQDVVILKTSPPQVCEVWLFAEVNAEVVALVSFWTLVKQDVAFSIWNKVDDPKMIPLEEIKCSLPFKNLKGNQFVVILPFHCR